MSNMPIISETNLLQLENISVIRQGKYILKDISLDMAARDFISIIGPNGGGKSTLLKAILGCIPLDEGQITAQENLKIGYVPQYFARDAAIPMKVEYFLKLHKQEFLGDIVTQLQIADLLHKPLAELSGGELQRVLLARSLMDSPNLLILDEPAQNLDVKGQQLFYQLLDEIYQHYALAIIMVSHDLHMVMSSTQHVLCLNQHICCAGEPSLMRQNPEFQKLFGKDMARLMAFYQHQHDHHHDDFTSDKAE